MQPSITVLTHISSDVTQPSLFVTARNGKKYLIGRIGEGFQRMLGEKKVRASKLSGIFLTGDHSWESVSGLPGMLLSFADRELDVSKIHTGLGKPYQKATRMINSWGKFSFHQPLASTALATPFSDDNLHIQPLTFIDSVSYVVQLQPIRGKFMVDKARALGVAPGKAFGQLSNGDSITIPDTGRVVEPHEVMGPSPTPTRVIVLDLPSMDHVKSVLADPQSMLKSFTERKRKLNDREYDSEARSYNANNVAHSPADNTTQPEFELKAVYYFFGAGVDPNAAEVAQLIELLSSVTTQQPVKHFISHPRTSPDFNALATIAEFQAVFRQEFPDHFSLLYSRPAELEVPPILSAANVRILEQQHVLSIAHVERSEATPGYPPKGGKKQKRIPDEEPAPEPRSRDVIEGLEASPLADLEEAEIITLGTGASAPSKYRNVSGTLVRCAEGAFLFDSGEGTYNTLGRIYGPEGRRERIRELRIVYVSHMHADHHLGAQQILRAWLEEARTLSTSQSVEPLRKLNFVAPKQMLEFIEQWSEIDNFGTFVRDHIQFVDVDRVCIGNRYSSQQLVAEADIAEVQELTGFRITACTALHCAFSYNVSVSTPNNTFKVSYSGDTRPNRYFANMVGLNSDLLIHEATHENELAEEALKKRHSTIGEALGIARDMRAKNTILTHISQRYPRLPTIGGEGATVGQNQYACFGFDAMHTKLSQIRNLQQMVPRMGEMLEALESEAEDTDDEMKR